MPNSRKSYKGGKINRIIMPAPCDIRRGEKYDAMIARMRQCLEEQKTEKQGFQNVFAYGCPDRGREFDKK